MVLTSIDGVTNSYVSSPTTNSGLVSCQFHLASAGTYYVYTKVYGLDATHDSFFFDFCDSAGLNCTTPTCSTDLDAACLQIYDTASDKDPDGADPCVIQRVWDTVSWKMMNMRNFIGGTCTGEGARYSTTLSAGDQTINFRQRDPDTRLYYVIISDNPDLNPGDPSPTPTPAVGCPGSCSIPAFARRHRWLCYHIHSCPVL